MNDTLYIFGTFHHYNNKMNPFLIAVDSSLNIKWFKAFSHNLPNLDITAIHKVNDSLILVSGGHSIGSGVCSSQNCNFFGLFNVKNQSFIWSKSFSQNQTYGTFMDIAQISTNSFILLAHRDDYDLNNSVIVKIDLNGNVIYQKLISVGVNLCTSLSSINDKLFISCLFWDGYHRSRIIAVDTLGNAIFSKKLDFQFLPNRIFRTSDGFLVVGLYGAGDPSHIFIYKIDFNGNFMWAKQYRSSLGSSRAFNIAQDWDGNYLISGYIEVNSTTSYPLVMKIDNNGNLIWARAWNTTPPNTSSNLGKGVISIGQGKFYLLTFIGSGADASGGFAIIREDTNPNLVGHCTEPINLTVNSFTPIIGNQTLTITNANYTLSNLSLTPYNPTINQTTSCQITPVSNYEFYKSCFFEIRANKGYIDIKLKEKNNVIVYDIIGNVVYSEFFEGERNVKVKNGIYVIKVGKEKVKMVVR